MQYLVYIFYALFPFLTYKFLYTGTSSRFVNLGIFISILIFTLVFKYIKDKQNISVPKSLIFYGIGLYGFVLLLSGVLGNDLHTSLWSTVTRTSGIVYLSYVAILIFGLLQIFKDIESTRKLILVVITSSAIYSLCTLLGPQGWNVIFTNSGTDAFTFGNSSFAGMYIVGSFLLSLYYLKISAIKKWWMYIISILIIIGPNTFNRSLWSFDFSNGFAGEARASSYALIISLIVLGIVYLVSKIKSESVKKKTAYVLFGLSIVAGIGFSISLLTQGGFVREFYLSQSTAARPIVWEMSTKVISERPLLGWGTENFERVFESKYDNRLLQENYGGEAWFDRAHNVVIDQLVDNGYVGLLAYLFLYGVIIYLMIYCLLNSANSQNRILASILLAYFVSHLFELQTAFDTTISYPIVALYVFLAILVVKSVKDENKKDSEWKLSRIWSGIVIGIICLYVIWSLFVGVFPFISAQIANLKMRTIGTTEARLLQYEKVAKSPIDVYGFTWRAIKDFQIGITKSPQVIADPQKLSILRKEMVAFEEIFASIINSDLTHLRAHLNLADSMIFQSILGVDKLDDAQIILDKAISLSPQSPQPYWMKSVAYLYAKKFDLAKEYAKKAYDLNPNVGESSRIVEYIDKSIKTFPEIDLYQFKQI